MALTASAVMGEREKALEIGMDDYLAKPVSPVVLDRMLSKWLFDNEARQSLSRHINPTSPQIPNDSVDCQEGESKLEFFGGKFLLTETPLHARSLRNPQSRSTHPMIPKLVFNFKLLCGTLKAEQLQEFISRF